MLHDCQEGNSPPENKWQINNEQTSSAYKSLKDHEIRNEKQLQWEKIKLQQMTIPEFQLLIGIEVYIYQMDKQPRKSIDVKKIKPPFVPSNILLNEIDLTVRHNILNSVELSDIFT